MAQRHAATFTLSRVGLPTPYITNTPGTGLPLRQTERFTFNNVSEGTYTLVIEKPGHTTFTIRNIVVPASGTVEIGDRIVASHVASDYTVGATVNIIRLIAGDLMNAGEVNISSVTDVIFAAGTWMAPSTEQNPLVADLLLSGEVSIAQVTDVIFLPENWMRTDVDVTLE
jgi:hypothetical protein